MENIVSGVNTFNSSIGDISKTTLSSVETSLDKMLKNPIIYGLIAVVLTVYGPRLQPKLPPMVRNLFNNNVFRFLVILLITYLSSRSLELSLIVSIAFCLIISYTTSQEIKEQFIEQFSEKYSNYHTITEDFTSNTTPVAGANTLTPVAGANTPPTPAPNPSTSQINVPVAASTPSWANKCASITDKTCVDYCLSQVGRKDPKCLSHFPNNLVQLDCMNAKTDEEKEDCLKLSCDINKTTGLNSYCSLIQKIDDTSSNDSN